MTASHPHPASDAVAEPLLQMLLAARDDIGPARCFDDSTKYLDWTRQTCDGQRAWVIGQPGLVRATALLGKRDSEQLNIASDSEVEIKASKRK